jgi:CheY-like chemotaxis protein
MAGEAKALILVVHPKVAHSRPVETLLEGAGYEVVSATEVDEVLTLAKCGQPDLVVVTGEDPSLLSERMQKAAKAPMLVVTTGEVATDAADEEFLRCSLRKLLEKVSEYLASPADGSRAES